MTENSSIETSSPRRPRVVMVVVNEVTYDSRVQKTALSVAEAGYEVTVVGYSPSGARTSEMLGPVEIIRVPVDFAHKKAARAAAEAKKPERNPEKDNRDRVRQASWQLRDRERATRIAELRTRIDEKPGGGPAARLTRAQLWLRLMTVRRVRLADRAVWRKRKGNTDPVVEDKPPKRRRKSKPDWRAEVPVLHDFEIAFTPVVADLEPDLIHAHDYQTLPIVSNAVKMLRARGIDVKWVYDAHEYVRGLPDLEPAALEARIALESAHIRGADAVVTVSPLLAQRLEADHQLSGRPDVVLNAPLLGAWDPQSPHSVRAAAGVDPDATLMVYAGGVKKQRGVDTVIRALPSLPDTHFAIVVSSTKSPAVGDLLELASELGCAERVHMVSYVEQDQVSNYIRTADVGVHTILPSGNAEVALPNKLFEYMHALLPAVVSDAPSMAAVTREVGSGEAFQAGNPTDFARAVGVVLSDRDHFRLPLMQPELRWRFSWEAQAEVLLSAYKRILGAGHVAVPAETEVPARFHGTAAVCVSARHGTGTAAALARTILHRSDGCRIEVLGAGDDATHAVSDEDWRDLDWQLDWLRHVADSYSHVLLAGGEGVLGTLNGRTISGDAPFLAQRGIAAAVLLDRAAATDPSAHAARDETSPYSRADPYWTEREQERWNRLSHDVAASGLPVFVSTLEAVDDISNARWLPFAIDVDELDTPSGPPFAGELPKLTYVRGDDPSGVVLAVEAVCRRLADEGVISFDDATADSGEPFAQRIRDADIVVGPLGYGDYGRQSCAALAAGRIVVGHVGAAVRRALPRRLPIVEATTEDLESVIRTIVADRAPWQVLAREGPDFVRAVHDGRLTVAALAPFLQLQPGGASHPAPEPAEVAATEFAAGAGA